ncbi:MAG: HAD family hydrolase [Candidatus Lokiarchaeota archaeon]|nr:HAD family hydrolase [Candidatus Lokiarchaeota archaeon]
MPHLKAIFYDMDGTLTHFLIDYILARKRAIEELEHQGIPNTKDMFSPNNPSRVTLTLARKYMKDNLKFTEERIRWVLDKVHERIVEVEREAALRAIKVDEMEELLQFGKRQNFKQIVCTFNTHEVAVTTLKKAGLFHYFDAIYGRDDVKHPKPHRNHLEIPAKRFGFSPDETLLIGDMQFDIQAARNFGCISIGIRTNFEINTIENADYIVDQHHASKKIIQIIQSCFQI